MTTTTNSKHSSEITKRRKAKGLSQLDVALAAGVCLNTVSLAERSSRFSTEVGQRLAKALGCKVEDLLASTGPRR